MFWTDQATLTVLNLIRDLNFVHVLQSKRQRNQQTFITIEEHLSPLGYDWSWQQIRCHWKNLKSRYNHERRILRPGQKSTWKYYSAMEGLLKHRPGLQDVANARIEDSDNSSGAENSPGSCNHRISTQTSSESNEPSGAEFIVPTLQGPGSSSANSFVQQVELATREAGVQVKKEVESDEVASAATDNFCGGGEAGAASSRASPGPPTEPAVASPPEAVRPGGRCARRRYVFSSCGSPGLAERKARLELDVLAATKRKMVAEQLRAEAEQSRAVAETLLLAESLRKCEEEKKRAMAETMFLVQERIRSEEETRRAAAVAALRAEEKRKAAAEADLFVEHKRYFAQQRKTELVKRQMLVLELQKLRRELKLGP